MKKFILNSNHDAVVCDDFEIWGFWCSDIKNRVVRQVTIKRGKKKYFVSTVFLGLDHNFMNQGFALLFETMIFDDNQPKKASSRDLYQNRYVSWDDAIKGHAEACRLVCEGAFDE